MIGSTPMITTCFSNPRAEGLALAHGGLEAMNQLRGSLQRLGSIRINLQLMVG